MFSFVHDIPGVVAWRARGSYNSPWVVLDDKDLVTALVEGGFDVEPLVPLVIQKGKVV